MTEKKDGIPQLWAAHAKSNRKIMSAIIGDIAISIVVVFFYIVNFGWDMGLFGFIALMAVKPYIIMLVNILSKGEVKSLQIEINLSKEREKHLRKQLVWEEEKNNMLSKLAYEREITEWRVQVAALTGKPVESVKQTAVWNQKNDQIGYLLKKGMTNGYVKKEVIDELCEENGVELPKEDKKLQDTTIGH